MHKKTNSQTNKVKMSNKGNWTLGKAIQFQRENLIFQVIEKQRESSALTLRA